jgi:hypothetical protein
MMGEYDLMVHRYEAHNFMSDIRQGAARCLARFIAAGRERRLDVSQIRQELAEYLPETLMDYNRVAFLGIYFQRLRHSVQLRNARALGQAVLDYQRLGIDGDAVLEPVIIPVVQMVSPRRYDDGLFFPGTVNFIFHGSGGMYSDDSEEEQDGDEAVVGEGPAAGVGQGGVQGMNGVGVEVDGEGPEDSQALPVDQQPSDEESDGGEYYAGSGAVEE